jgi:hypothetical protein
MEIPVANPTGAREPNCASEAAWPRELRAAGKLLATIALAAFSMALPAAAAGTLTLSWTGGSWNDGGSLSGTFTVQYDSNGTPTTLLSADVITGNGTSDGFAGQTYIYDVTGQTTNVVSYYFDATQHGGDPANELVMTNGNGYRIFLDWQGTSPTGLWVGNVGSQYSSENTPSYSIVRYLDSSAGSPGSPVIGQPSVPVLSSPALAGLALLLAALGWVFTRKVPAHC